ncbi:NfeD family protein [Candidatus Kaiserbacteria bacterium]|nr:NfeD family protein [Candidatus Kaiserbacteria bacterium]
MYVETSTLAWVLAGSLLFLLVSALLGGHHDVDALGDCGLDFGTDGSHDGVTTSEIFNFRNLALLAAGFSAVSLLARNMGAKDPAVYLWGIAGGVLMITVGVWLFRVVRRQEASSVTSNQKLIGHVAFVTVAIPEKGFGEISLRNVAGVATALPARSDTGAIATGFEVKITAVAGNIATVARAA